MTHHLQQAQAPARQNGGVHHAFAHNQSQLQPPAQQLSQLPPLSQQTVQQPVQQALQLQNSSQQPLQQPPQPLMQLEQQLVAQLPAQQPLRQLARPVCQEEQQQRELETTLQRLRDCFLAARSLCLPNSLIKVCKATQLHQLDDVIRCAENAKNMLLSQLPRLPAPKRQCRQVKFHALHPRIVNIDADTPFCMSSLGFLHEVTLRLRLDCCKSTLLSANMRIAHAP